MEPLTETSFRSPRYEQIAIDVAKKISNGIYSPGTKLHGRTTLAGIYKVSPETIRKAMAILEEAGALEVLHGNGAVILSREAAGEYLVQAGQEEKFRKAVSHFYKLLEEHKRLGAEMESVLTEITNFMQKSS